MNNIIKTCYNKKEGFIQNVGLVFDGITVLVHVEGGFLWCGKDKKEEMSAKFDELIKVLRSHGFKIEGVNPLRELPDFDTET